MLFKKGIITLIYVCGKSDIFGVLMPFSSFSWSFLWTSWDINWNLEYRFGNTEVQIQGVFCFFIFLFWNTGFPIGEKTYLTVRKRTYYRINRQEFVLKGRRLENLLKLNSKAFLFEFIFRNAILLVPVLTCNWQVAILIITVFPLVQLASLSFSE